MATNGESAFNVLSDVTALSRRGVDDFVKVQAELFDKFQDLSRDWVKRWQAEANLLTDFGVRLATARTVGDAASAYQDVANRQLELTTEDMKRFVTGAEMFARGGVGLFANGWPSATGGHTKQE
jgi:Phasin protein